MNAPEPVVLSHVGGDGDIIRAWLDHYLSLGVASFRLIIHGSKQENAALFQTMPSYPIVVIDEYDAPFQAEEQAERLTDALDRLRGRWVIVADSDEFVEFPYSLSATIRAMEWVGAEALYAPMLQRLRADGALSSAAVIADPFREFPACSTDLYCRIGVGGAAIDKYPLFFCAEGARVTVGNHGPQFGTATAVSGARGATHHFKWRGPVLDRLRQLADSDYNWRHETKGFLSYLRAHQGRLPLDGSFTYSRRELFRRRLLRRMPPWYLARLRGRKSWVPTVLRREACRLVRHWRAAGGAEAETDEGV